MTQPELKIRFIEAVINKELDVRGRRRADVIADMQRLDFPAELLYTIRLSEMTQSHVDSLKGKTVPKG